MASLFHPKLMQHLAPTRGNALGTVQRLPVSEDSGSESNEQNSFGAIAQNSLGEESTDYTDDPDLTDIPCQVEPHITRGDEEVRRPDQTIVTNSFDILLYGYYPTIHEVDRFTITTPRQETHNILRVAHQDVTYTTLTTEIVT